MDSTESNAILLQMLQEVNNRNHQLEERAQKLEEQRKADQKAGEEQRRANEKAAEERAQTLTEQRQADQKAAEEQRLAAEDRHRCTAW